MSPFLRYILPFIALALCFACEDKPSLPRNEHDRLREQVTQVANTGITPQNGDSLKGVWLALYQHPNLQPDTVLMTKVCYNLARLYGMQGQDSAKFYIEQALERIEPTTRNYEDKALVYNGIGNIRSLVSKLHEANYYYNKAAAIVLSDSTLDLSAEAKSIMLLSAAQSNRMTFQLDLAEKMIRAAIPLCDALPEGHISHQRVLVQLIQVLNKLEKPADSIAPYLQKLEKLHLRYPDKYDVGFLYECKVNYFEVTAQKDSLLHYQLLKAQSDKERYETEAENPIAINNLFIDYCNLGGTYVVLHQAMKAEEAFQKAKQLLTKYKALMHADNEVIYQHNLASLYQLQGKKEEAIALLFRTAQLQKSIYQTENTQSVAEMNALYQLQAKDRSIRTLNESIQINQLQLQQNRLWLAVSVLGTVLLGVTLLFLYYSFRQRRAYQEKEQLLLQQQLLRTQMEPHFIFNTLSAVQSFVRLDQKEQAIKYLHRFSRLLRSSLELSREALVPLDEEIETLENYLSLQQMRFDHAFTYRIEQPPGEDFSTAMLPPMLIQPYVENAILHGIDLTSGKGNMAICFQLEDDLLEVKITDSGKTGIPAQDAAHRSLSGTISRERIHLLGKKASITSTSTESGGTVITLCIPIVYG